jgi:hypothetical protein
MSLSSHSTVPLLLLLSYAQFSFEYMSLSAEPFLSL